MSRERRLLAAALLCAALLAMGARALTEQPARIFAAPPISVAITTATTPPTLPPVPVATTATLPPAPVAGCAPAGHSAVVDRAAQRTWLCDNGQVTQQFVMTSAVSQPDPGQYAVYAKDRHATSQLHGRASTMEHFVAFTYGKYRGARIAFHSIPQWSNGTYAQPLDAVGSADWFGDSAGCIRVLPDDAVAIWQWLQVGDPVIVVS